MAPAGADGNPAEIMTPAPPRLGYNAVMDARTYACSACGAQVDEHARRCRFCTAPIATVRCACCFHMNVPEASYCSGCGQKLGLEPVGEAGTLLCPVCKRPLEAYRGGADPERARGGTLFDCDVCGGQFVEHALLHELVQRHDHTALPGDATHPSGPLDARSSYIPCPECGALMNRKNFAEVSGVIVDVCKKHGTWFDLGELPRVLAFVAAGGLTRSRHRGVD
jgi:Zn-finger nucleic acid-binding protein